MPEIKVQIEFKLCTFSNGFELKRRTISVIAIVSAITIGTTMKKIKLYGELDIKSDIY